MTTEVLERKPGHSGPGAPGRGDDRPGGGGGPAGPGAPGILGDPALFGLVAFLGTVTMLFIGFTSAYILRRASADWQPLAAPPVLWLNTALLLASSAGLEAARRRLRGWDLAGSERWLLATGLLGLLFVAGQYVGWRQLAARGRHRPDGARRPRVALAPLAHLSGAPRVRSEPRRDERVARRRTRPGRLRH